MSAVAPKVIQLNPARAGVEVGDGIVTLVFIVAHEVYHINVGSEAWAAMVEQQQEKATGIAVVKAPELIVPG